MCVIGDFFTVQVKNLRSSVARAAIACFGDLFATVGPAMEKVCVCTKLAL